MVDTSKTENVVKFTAPPNPFDPASLRLDQSFTGAGVQKLLTAIPVRKPNRFDFVRVHPSAEYHLTVALIEFKEEREVYVVMPAMAETLRGEWHAATLFTTMNRQGVLSLWPVKITAEGDKQNTWNDSAAVAAEKAVRRWVRVGSNMSLGAYETFEAEAKIPDPEWPTLSMAELLQIAFKDRLIDSMNHPVVKRLRGLV